ncbi:MAG: endonuclease III domain-containing protein [Thermoplasmata archaeon]
MIALNDLYEKLFEKYGDLHWWPGDSLDEIIIGAVLTQRTSWNNVEKAIKNLKEKGILSLEAVLNSDEYLLKECIRPSGFYQSKACVLKRVSSFFSINKIKEFEETNDIEKIRRQLLDIKGIGPETADSILLYGFNKRIFVVDAYTKRIIERIGYKETDYDGIQKLFEKTIKADVEIYKNYHAVIVQHGKEVCRKKPLCNKCVIKEFCNYSVP